MSDVGYEGQSVLRIAVLPARVAYLVRDGSESGARRAVQEACTRWAGASEPIIPVKQGGEIDPWWRQVASVAAVDEAVNVDVAEADVAATGEALGIDVIGLADIDRAGTGMFTMHPGGIGPANTSDVNSFVIAPAPGTLCDVVGAGDLTEAHMRTLNDAYLSVRRAPDDQIARAQLGQTTLLDRTKMQFGEHSSRSGPSACPAVVWVTDTGSVEDCLFFWNLRALRPLRFQTVPMLLLPVDQVQHWLGFSDQLAHVLARPAQFAPDVVMRSISVPESKLDETAAHLSLQRTTDEVRSGMHSPAPNRQPPFTYRTDVDPRLWFVFERTYGQITQVDAHLFRDTTTIRFTSPVSFSTGGAALIRIWGPPFDALPRRPAIAAAVEGSAVWSHGAIQLKTFAQDEYWLELHVPSLSEATDRVLRESARTYELSDKGRLGSALRDSADTAVLLEPWMFEVITKLTTPRSRDLLRELKRLRSEGVVDDELADLAARWGGRASRRYQSPSQLSLPAHANASALLERLCQVGWAERGLQAGCPACGMATFIELTSTSDQATCPGCHSPARYDADSSLVVYYRLNSYLDRASDQGVLPHLLVDAVLSRREPKSYFIPGIQIRFADDTEAEMDIFGISNAQVIAGEVKTKAVDFTAEQLERDARLSKRVGADIHVLACMDALPESVADDAKQIFDSLDLALLILGKDDLRPGMSADA
ncbi:MAG: hypothetical protein ACLQFR_07920 [Streptosporangiaceae bacterium]